jgi:pimeloyl-ACP methyl ester carboxylesterase
MHYSKIYYKKLTPNVDSSKLPHIIWGHGWANSHVSLLPIANNLKNLGTHWLLDFPGFGLTAKPETEAVWGIKEYTEITMDWIKGTIPIDAPKIWIGHSFGCRVGINLAASEPKLLQGLLLIAASGIPRPRNLLQKVRFKSKIYITFNGTLDKFIKSNMQNKETNLQIQKMHTDSKSLFWLFDSCCNKLDSLDVYTFLAN